MKKIILFTCFLLSLAIVKAQQENKYLQQFILVVRFPSNFIPPSAEAVQQNIQKWQEYMGNLIQNKTLVKGYRPTTEGFIISGKEKQNKEGFYVANNELLSSVMIIQAKDMDAAKKIANECPVFELGGSIEIRPLMEMAGK
jgi:hypothetical protein